MIKQYLPADFQVSIKAMPKRLESTAPPGATRDKLMQDDMPNTAKGGKHK